jgi:hypothetical protein
MGSRGWAFDLNHFIRYVALLQLRYRVNVKEMKMIRLMGKMSAEHYYEVEACLLSGNIFYARGASVAADVISRYCEQTAINELDSVFRIKLFSLLEGVSVLPLELYANK